MQVYLLEDALDLWEATLRGTPSPASQPLLDLVPFLLPCVEVGTITLRKVLALIESYVLLAPREMIEVYRTPLFDAFASLLGTLKPESNSIVTHVVEIVVRAGEALGCCDVVGTELVRSGFLGVVVSGVVGCWEASQTTGPNRRWVPVEAVVETDYFSVLARMVLAGTGWAVGCVQAVGEEREGGVMEVVVGEWFRHVSVLGRGWGE